MKLVLLLPLLLTVMSGCTPHEVRYHTLVTPQTTINDIAPASFTIDLLPITVPAELDRQEVVIRKGNSDVVVLDDDRWLSPPGDELRTALSTGLTQQLNTVDVSGLADDTRPVVHILLQVRRFESWPGKSVLLDADWRLVIKKGDERSRLVCKSRLTQDARGKNMMMFSAWQTLVARLTTQIAVATVSLAGDNIADCGHDSASMR